MEFHANFPVPIFPSIKVMPYKDIFLVVLI